MSTLKSKFIVILIVLSLFTIIIGKLWFNQNSPNLVLYFYGILVSSVTLLVFLITYTSYKDPYFEAQKIPKSKKKNYSVTCMVAVRNEEIIIEKCIQSLINQTYKKKEIIFVNDASTDNTKAVLDEYANKGLIKVIYLEENVGKKKALAKAMLQAKGEIFAFSDSDSVWAPDALEKVVDVFNLDELIGAVSGHCRALNGDKNLITKIQDSWYEGQFSIRKAFESVFGSVTCVSGPLAVFRKSAIFNYIPAWENDKFLGQEFKFATDRTLTGFVLCAKSIGKKLKRKYSDSPFIKAENFPERSWKVLYCKSARSWTEVPDTFRKMLRQQIRWKKSFIRNSFFTGKHYWKKPLPVSFVYYMHIAFVLVGPLIAFRHLIYLPIQGNLFSAFLYIAGVLFLGFTFGLAYKVEHKNCHKWIYRPLMSLMSTMVLSWLIFYSALTIRNNKWLRSNYVKEKIVKETVIKHKVGFNQHFYNLSSILKFKRGTK